MIKNEKELTAAVSKYLRKTKELPWFLKKTYAVEYKFLKKNKLNFKSDMRPQQLPALFQAKEKGLYHKISDQSQGIKPFDAFNLVGCDVWLAVGFDKWLYYLQADNVYLLERCGVAGLTKDEIKKLAMYKIKYE